MAGFCRLGVQRLGQMNRLHAYAALKLPLGRYKRLSREVNTRWEELDWRCYET